MTAEIDICFVFKTGKAEPALVDKGPTARAKSPRPPRRVRVDWWERALSPQLRTDYEMYYG
jgi:hypothetical protein